MLGGALDAPKPERNGFGQKTKKHVSLVNGINLFSKAPVVQNDDASSETRFSHDENRLSKPFCKCFWRRRIQV